MELWSIGAAKTGVMSNLGISYFPIFTIEEELKNGMLIPVRTELDEEKVTVVATYHKNKFISQLMELFLHLLHDTLSNYAA